MRAGAWLRARFDWTLLTGHRFERPWFLAGGLDPWNVAEAVSQSGAPIVEDVSWCVRAGSGPKRPRPDFGLSRGSEAHPLACWI